MMQKNQNNNKTFVRSVLLGALTGVVMALMFVAGLLFRDIVGFPAAAASPLSADPYSYPLLDEVQQLIDNHYLHDQPAYDQRQYAAIRGMIGSLQDPYTFFIDPPVAQSESDVLAGTYGGVGVQISRSEAGELVLFPIPESPAEDAGIEDGDILVAVDGTPVDISVQQDAIDQMLRGEVTEGNGVTLTLRKASTNEEVTVFVLFDVINVPSVLWRLLDENEQIGYVQIIRFTSRTPEELQDALQDLNDGGAEGLIVDMRNNNGGLLRESVDVADEFIDEGVVLYEERVDGERVFEAEAGGLAIEQPLVVLVNRGTASAAELVAGAIQDLERGILIGQTTFGKGTVQQIFRLSDESSIHITSAEWFTPNRNELDGVGLEPDIAMIPDESGRDVELGEAIRYLQQNFESLRPEPAVPAAEPEEIPETTEVQIAAFLEA